MKLNGKVLGLAFAMTLGCWAVVWAITVSEIWNSVYDSANSSLRITQVSP